MHISIVIPCFNARGKIEACLGSLRRIEFPPQTYEIVFVDDCSTDGTYELLVEECLQTINWRVERLTINSGSPSRPRNVGTEHARGEYILYLDCDDEILPDTLSVHYARARATNACIVRGYLIVDDGQNRREMNRIFSWKPRFSKVERMRAILSEQSTTTSSLIRTDLLKEHKIAWHEDVRMSEDTLFLIDVLCAASNIEYIDHATFIYHKKISIVPSSTRNYGARELQDHLFSWKTAEDKLKNFSLSYYRLRLHISLETSATALIFHNRGDINECIFERFSVFINSVWSTVKSSIHNKRVREILEAVRSSDFKTFKQLCKPRLVIAGQDLKFISPSVDNLSQYFDIRIDEWEGHEHHDHHKSQEMLNWAEFIWCEWLLGNAVWYADNKLRGQKLVIRMHRMELARDFGAMLNLDNVNAVVTVSVLFFERLLERFPAIPRAKVRLIPNYSSLGERETFPAPERLFKLAMIGIVPARKGFLTALEILFLLRQKNPQYQMEVFGNGPEHFTWVTRDPMEMQYYKTCQTYMEQNDLEGAVIFRGQCDLPGELSRKRIGFVLSVSDSPDTLPGPESFHLAVLDGYAGGGQSVVLRWDGCEYIYPENIIFDSKEKIVEHISNMTSEQFYTEGEAGRELIELRYAKVHFVSSVRKLFSEWV